jgi:hypothetical protein
VIDGAVATLMGVPRDLILQQGETTEQLQRFEAERKHAGKTA